MSFEKGHKKHPGAGRPKGSENKITREVKSVIQFMVNHIGDPDAMRERLDRIDAHHPEVLVHFMAKVAPKELNVKGDVERFVLMLPDNGRDKPE